MKGCSALHGVNPNFLKKKKNASNRMYLLSRIFGNQSYIFHVQELMPISLSVLKTSLFDRSIDCNSEIDFNMTCVPLSSKTNCYFTNLGGRSLSSSTIAGCKRWISGFSVWNFVQIHSEMWQENARNTRYDWDRPFLSTSLIRLYCCISFVSCLKLD